MSNEIMNIEINEKMTPSLCFFEHSGQVFGLDKHSNGIFEIDIKKDKVKFLGVISKVYGIKSPFSKVIVYEEQLFFVPYNYDKMLIYHIENAVWEEVDLNVNKNEGLFIEAFVLKDTLYCLPFNYEKIVKVELKSKNVEYVDLFEVYHEPKKRMFIKFLVLDDENIILPLFSANKIMKYHVNGCFEIIELPRKDFQINTITKWKDCIYLLSRNSLEILKLNLNLEIVDCIKIQSDITPIGTELTYFTQSGFFVVGNDLYCFPARWNHVIKMDVQTGKSKIIDTLDFLSKRNVDSEKINKFNHGIVLNNKLYIQNFDEKILVFDLKDETFQIISTKENDLNSINLKSYIRHIINL